jgi:hypothetical protein
MSEVKSIVVAGSTDLADRVVDIASRRASLDVARWRSTDDSLVSTAPVFVVADSADRPAFTADALESGAEVVTLPLADSEGGFDEAIRAGKVRQISQLNGIPALAYLQEQMHTGYRGTRYGIFAAHRLPRASEFNPLERLNDLLVYVVSLIGVGVRSVRVTPAAFTGDEPDSWFVLARFDDDTVATVEVSTVLPAGSSDPGSLLVEVTGSDVVLRAEPERQAVRLNLERESTTASWYADLAGGLLDAAVRVLEHDQVDTQVAVAALLRAVDTAAANSGRLTIT